MNDISNEDFRPDSPKMHKMLAEEYDDPVVNGVAAWLVAALAAAESGLERERMRLAACGVAANANTKSSRQLGRLDEDSPYWSASYLDVRQAVAREMEHRDRADKAESDCLAMATRLYLEPEGSHSPDTREVMDRWRPKCETILAEVEE